MTSELTPACLNPRISPCTPSHFRSPNPDLQAEITARSIFERLSFAISSSVMSPSSLPCGTIPASIVKAAPYNAKAWLSKGALLPLLDVMLHSLMNIPSVSIKKASISFPDNALMLSPVAVSFCKKYRIIMRYVLLYYFSLFFSICIFVNSVFDK